MKVKYCLVIVQFEVYNQLTINIVIIIIVKYVFLYQKMLFSMILVNNFEYVKKQTFI